MKAKLEFKLDKFDAKMDAMLRRGNDMRAYFNTVLFRQYQQAQINRWKTENASEGMHWEPLKPKYREWKLKRYSSFPGGGSKLLVATGQLSRAAIGQDPNAFRKIISRTSARFQISSQAIPYASHVAEHRPFMRFGNKTKQAIKNSMRAYFLKGKVPRGGL